MSELYLASFLPNIAVCSFSCCCSISFLCLKLWCDSSSIMSCSSPYLPAYYRGGPRFQRSVSHHPRTSCPSEFTSGFGIIYFLPPHPLLEILAAPQRQEWDLPPLPACSSAESHIKAPVPARLQNLSSFKTWPSSRRNCKGKAGMRRVLGSVKCICLSLHTVKSSER